jgi:hypothetical protein
MTCREFNDWLDDLLHREAGEPLPADVARHRAECAECAREHALALEAIAALTPPVSLGASPQLRQRIFGAIPTSTFEGDCAEPSPACDTEALQPMRNDRPGPATGSSRGAVPPRRRWPRLALAVAAAVLLAVSLYLVASHAPQASRGRALSLLNEASAAEARLFAGDHLVSLRSEIVVEPVDDAGLIAARGFPLAAVGPDGRPRLILVKLGGRPRLGYTVLDQSWYDPATRRFARVLSLEGRPLFANSYDGKAVHLLELNDQGEPRISDEPVTREFKPPSEPAEFLGFSADLRSVANRPDRRDLFRDAGPTKLRDGTTGRLLRSTNPGNDGKTPADSYAEWTIRDDDHTVESEEVVVRGRTIYRVRTLKGAGNSEPQLGWDLAGARRSVGAVQPTPPVQTVANFINADISVAEMVERADYPVYLFASAPSWATERRIADILDTGSPPHRTFLVTYRAQDNRNVVLSQSHPSENVLAAVHKQFQLLYTAPTGVKVWTGEALGRHATNLLSKARGFLGADPNSLGVPPAKDCSSYLLETPGGTIATLAVNGTLTEAELHSLVDSLLPAGRK